MKILRIIQVYDNTTGKGRNKENMKGRGYRKAYRLNPYNPLSYITIVVIAIMGVIMFGVVGIFEQTDNRNPFKWN